nr:MAG TPA: hypothetical protein [Caudoviricetes sp.]
MTKGKLPYKYVCAACGKRTKQTTYYDPLTDEWVCRKCYNARYAIKSLKKSSEKFGNSN